MRRIALHVVQGALLASVVACKSMTPAFARLESAVVDDRYAGSLGRANLRVVRRDTVLSPMISMRLAKGDSIITSRTTRVVVNFAAGYEVTLDTSTAIYIENPSIFLRIGQAFIRKVLGTRPDTARLDTHTPQATLHDEGTEYLIAVSGQGTDVLVLSGAVEASSRDGGWSPRRYEALQGGRIDAQRGPQGMQRLTQSQAEARIAWVRRVERTTKVQVPSVDSMTEAAARSALDRAGFRVLFVLHRETDAVAPGLVVDQSPAAGQLAPPGTYVTLTLSKAARGARGGEATADCTVPDIERKRETEARRLLEAARLRGQVTRRDPNAVTVGRQELKKGSRVACGTIVRYTVETIVE